jgi:hypothetical protein
VPVHTVTGAALPDKLTRFHAALRERGLLTEPGDARAGVSPLRETEAVAAKLRERMSERQSPQG